MDDASSVFVRKHHDRQLQSHLPGTLLAVRNPSCRGKECSETGCNREGEAVSEPLIATRSVTYEGVTIGSIRTRNGTYLATIPGNPGPDYECNSYEKAVALLMQWHAANEQKRKDSA